MQRIYIFLIIAAIVFAASYSDTIKQFFTPEKPGEETVPEQNWGPVYRSIFSALDSRPRVGPPGCGRERRCQTK